MHHNNRAADRVDDGIESRLEAALASRAPLLGDPNLDAYRLVNGRRDNFPGLVADRFGNVIVVQAVEGTFKGDEATLRAVSAWLGPRVGVEAVYAKSIPHDRGGKGGKDEAGLTDPQPLWGSPVAPEIPVCENGIRYLVRPYDGFLVGLFLDHRENRDRIRRAAPGRRMLNLFCYTCSFSVAAAMGGAASTANVDASKKSLEWGKRNFEVNGIALDDHRFYCCDVFDFFKRAHRHEWRYDLIVVDPPTFGRSKKPLRVFQVVEDMARLLAATLTVLDRGGMMLVSTNHRALSAAWLREQIRTAAGERRVHVLETPALPPDFTGAKDANKTILVQYAGA